MRTFPNDGGAEFKKYYKLSRKTFEEYVVKLRRHLMRILTASRGPRHRGKVGNHAAFACGRECAAGFDAGLPRRQPDHLLHGVLRDTRRIIGCSSSDGPPVRHVR